jgi:hypothetical protein
MKLAILWQVGTVRTAARLAGSTGLNNETVSKNIGHARQRWELSISAAYIVPVVTDKYIS